MSPDTQKIARLEQQILQLVKQNQELNHRVTYLERENSRRRSETAQIASTINKKG